jgi:hypothetical protein
MFFPTLEVSTLYRKGSEINGRAATKLGLNARARELPEAAV